VSTADALITVNGRDYCRPRQRTVVITIDGCQPAYLDDGMARGLMPRLKALLADGGTYQLGRGQMPSLTNPNNVSIVTGVAPAVHGIPGNHFRAPDGSEVQLTDPSHLRCPTILGEMRKDGLRARIVSIASADRCNDVPALHQIAAQSANVDGGGTSADSGNLSESVVSCMI
jgi:phosphonoacetate hydrolase